MTKIHCAPSLWIQSIQVRLGVLLEVPAFTSSLAVRIDDR
jgi:hypothetical protein